MSCNTGVAHGSLGLRCSKLELFSKIIKKMSYDVEFSKFLLNIL